MDRNPGGLFSARLREAMRERGYVVDVGGGRPRRGEMRAGQLAEKIGADPSVLSNYLAGKRDVGDLTAGLYLLRDLADELGVSFEWLAIGRGPKAIAALERSELISLARQLSSMLDESKLDRFNKPDPYDLRPVFVRKDPGSSLRSQQDDDDETPLPPSARITQRRKA